MRLAELGEMAADNVREIKTRQVAKYGAPHDIAPIIEAWRGEEPVCQIHMARHERDLILKVARMAAIGFDADMLALSFETYATSKGGSASRIAWINPMTGRRYGPGEMQDVAQNHGGIEKGWVTEAVSVTVVNRAADVWMCMQPYRYENGAVAWGEPETMDSSNELAGVMVQALSGAMTMRSASQMIPVNLAHLSRAQRDALTVEAISRVGDCVAILVARADDTQRLAELQDFADDFND